MTIKRYGTSSMPCDSGIYVLYSEYERVVAECERLRADAKRYNRLKSFAHPSYNVKAMSNVGIASLAKEEFLTVHVGSWEAMDAVLDGVVVVNTVNVKEQS